MDVKYITPFIDSLVEVLSGFGVSGIKRGQISTKDTMNVTLDITAVIGLIGDIRGNIAYSLSAGTAMGIVSGMMGGMPVTGINSMERSAISELANIITGTAASRFSAIGANIKPTPPSIVFGRDIYFRISPVQTIVVEMETCHGKIEINIGLEI